jgi:hypothetical protein
MTKRLTRQPAWLLIALLAGSALADETPARTPATERMPATAAGTRIAPVADVASSSTLGFALLPARFRYHTVPTAWSVGGGSRKAATGMAPMDYRDRAPLITRLKELDGLRLLTFWETRAFAVFFGVSRDGIAGLNITQKYEPETEEDDDRDETRPEDPAPDPTYLAASIYRR